LKDAEDVKTYALQMQLSMLATLVERIIAVADAAVAKRWEAEGVRPVILKEKYPAQAISAKR